MSFHKTKTLRELRIRVGKADSSFVYFTLESNEGMAFYSTYEESSDQDHRDLLVRCTPEFYAPLMEEFKHLQKKMPLEILSDNVVEDCAVKDSL